MGRWKGALAAMALLLVAAKVALAQEPQVARGGQQEHPNWANQESSGQHAADTAVLEQGGTAGDAPPSSLQNVPSGQEAVAAEVEQQQQQQEVANLQDQKGEARASTQEMMLTNDPTPSATEQQQPSPQELAQAEAAALAAVEAERQAAEQAATERQARLRQAEEELQRAEDLVGWAADEDGVDVARGLAMLQAMFARLDAHVDAALGESMRRRRLYTPPPVPPAPPMEAATGAEAAAEGDAAQDADAATATSDFSSSASPAQAADSVSPAEAAASDAGAATNSAAAPAAPPGSLDPAQHPELAPLSDAAFTLASLLASGLASAHSLPRNDSAAVYMLHRAALAGSLEARLALAERYTTGRGVPLLVDQGLGYAKQVGPDLLAMLDDSGAVHSEGGGHLRRKWMDAGYMPAANVWDDANTLHMEQDLAARGDHVAHRQLGYRMLTGQGLARDLAGALREFQVAARGGDPWAMYNLGLMYVRGMHVAQNYTLARKHFLDAAEQKVAPALNGLGVMYFHGQGVPVNMSEALRYFEMAAHLEHDGAFNLGTMYQGAYGVERNMSRAIELFVNATHMGSWRAPHQLFLVHADGLFGAPKDPATSMRHFWHFLGMTGGWKEAGKAAADRAKEGDAWGAAVRYALLAEQGNSLAQLNLAWLMHRGVAYGGADRHRLALPLWLRAAARNQTEGMLMAAHVLREGDKWGLEGGANLTAAVELYQQAAAAGSIEGLFTMGQLREQGLGVEQNTTEAVRLYKRAVQTAPAECYATAPFVALWWLRLRLLLGPLLRLLATFLPAALRRPGPAPAASAPPVAASAHAQAAGMPVAGWGRRSARSPAAQWDALAIAVMVGMLTWVLWRKRQLSNQQRQHDSPPSATANPTGNTAPQPSATDAGEAAAGAADGRVHVVTGPAASVPSLRYRSSAAAAAADAEEEAGPDAPPNPRL